MTNTEQLMIVPTEAVRDGNENTSPCMMQSKSAKQAGSDTAKVVLFEPTSKPISQALLSEACDISQLILVAGRYEGVDERFVEMDCDDEWSVGDYVISGGELAALVVIDAITRLLPGVLGHEESARQDSHMNGLLDYPHFYQA